MIKNTKGFWWVIMALALLSLVLAGCQSNTSDVSLSHADKNNKSHIKIA
ncbi:MAG: hypothetical protein JXB26_13135 [Candidatus Aminicenantes bacterium]|nr:hypothetical protein [Candidatus Aminicenantes bacterium]